MYFLIGALLGAVTGIPIGPVNVAVIDAAYRHSLRRAVGVALGGAAGDTIFAYLGMVWFGPWVASRPLVPPILYVLSGLALLVYGIVTVRSQEIETSASGKPENQEPGKFLGGFTLGFILIVLNPAALITWVVIVGTYFADITGGEGTACAVGVGCGSLLWFNFVAYLSNKGKNVLGHKMLWVTRTVGVLLIGYGLYSTGKGAWMLFEIL
jgi:threonine/homoserine/homoserine lactone efflux protein